MNLQKLKTNKLFYGQYPYKVTCRVDNAHYLRIRSIENIKNLPDRVFTGFYSKTTLLLTNLKEFIVHAEEYLINKNIKIRIESKNIDFYIKDRSTFQDIQVKLKDYLVRTSEPSSNEDLEILLESKKHNLCDNLPHGKFKYKVIFKDMPANVRLNLINWAEKYSDNEIHISKSTRIHFKGLKHKYGTHYFYVRDDKLITLIVLAASGYIRSTEEYVIRP